MYNEHLIKQFSNPLYNKKNLRKKQNVINNQTLKSNSISIIIYIILIVLAIAVIVLGYFLHKLTKRHYISDRTLFETTELIGYNTIPNRTGILHTEFEDNYRYNDDNHVVGHYDIIHQDSDITFTVTGTQLSTTQYQTSQKNIGNAFTIQGKSFIVTRVSFKITKPEPTRLEYKVKKSNLDINQVSIHYKDFGMTS